MEDDYKVIWDELKSSVRKNKEKTDGWLEDSKCYYTTKSTLAQRENYRSINSVFSEMLEYMDTLEKRYTNNH